MKELIRELIRSKGLRIALIVIMVVIGSNAALVIYYRNLILSNSEVQLQIQRVKDRISRMDTNLRLADIGVRAYIIKQDQDLLRPYTNTATTYAENLDVLEQELLKIDYNLKNMTPARAAIDQYMQDCKLMADLCNEGKVAEAISIFQEDRGYTAWRRYDPFVQDANQFVSQLSDESQHIYRKSVNSILVLQVLLILLSFPILTIVFRKSVRDDKFRSGIYQMISKSTRDYLFNDSNESDEQDEDRIISDLIRNLRRSASFINNIGKGNYDIDWEGMDEQLLMLNKDSIAGELIKMRDLMRTSRKKDEQRIWSNEGLSKFADLIRSYQNDLKDLSDTLIANIVEHLGAQQGGLFFLSEDDHQQRHLELVGCYAYQRKKFLEKRVELGQGMVGQCFLEAETIHVTNIPQNYVNITSGLGQSNPSTLLIVPLKY